MASLNQPVKLHEIHYLTGLKEHYDGQTVLITSGGRHVIAYNLKEMKVQTTWSLTSKKRSTLSCPAVASASNEHYIAVVDKQVVRLWDCPEQELEKAPKFTTPYPVLQILPLGVWSPMIIYENGRMAWFHEPAEVFGEPIEEGSKLTWCGVQQSDSKCILVMSSKSKDKIDLCVYNIRKDGDKESKVLRITHAKDGISSISCCLHTEKSSVYFIHLYSGGDLFKTCVSGSGVGETVKLHNVPGIQSYAVITSLGHTHLAIAGCCDSQTGKDGVCIWDMKFAVSQAWKPLPDETPEHPQLQVHVTHGQLILHCGAALFSFHFHVPPSQLGEALGKLSQKNMANAFQMKEAEDENLKSVLETLLLPLLTPGSQKFQRAFHKFKELADKKKDTLLLLQGLVTKLVSKCVLDNDHWSSKIISELVKLGVVTAGESSEVIQALCDHNELICILDCMRIIHDLPEKSLVQALTFFLRTSDQDFSHISDEEMESEAEDTGQQNTNISSPFGRVKATFINQVLLQPFNDVFMMEHIRRVDFALCLDLLHHLHYLLVITPATYEDFDISQQPNLQQVADWMNVLVDAHFPQLVLSTDARQLLIHLHEILTVQVLFYDELVGLEGILSQLREKSAIPQKQTPGVYCIQTLHIY